MEPSTGWKEAVASDEAERFERYASEIVAMQKRRAEKGGMGRGLHAKGTAGVRAEFTVLPDLPDYARSGIFAAPATYPAYVRFSNGSGARQADGRPDVRGVAIKLVGVPGQKIIPGMEAEKTQDLLLIQSPTTPFRNADEFVGLVRAAANPLLLIPRLLGHLGLARGTVVLKKLMKSLSTPIPSLATLRYFSALPIRCGDYAVHLVLAPREQSPAGATKGGSPDYLGEELAARLKKAPVIFDFYLQFYVEESRTPIEDASVEWKEEDAPLIQVGRLTLLQQDVNSAEGRRVAEFIERLSFDPWHALVEHRPLGDMMRARNVAYRESTKLRGASKEPDGTETFSSA